MSILLDTKVLKVKKLDRFCTLKVVENEAAGRIFVEFSSNDGKLVLQRNYLKSAESLAEAKKFERSIKSIKDLKKYFGIGIKEKKNVASKSVK